MAYNKEDELKRKIKHLSQITFVLKVVKFLLFFYSFISFIFWFLNCFEFDWLYKFSWIFVIPYIIVKKFYRPTGLSADFSLAIIGVISLLLGLLLELISSKLYLRVAKLQEDLEKFIQQRKLNMQQRKLLQSKNSRPRPNGGVTNKKNNNLESLANENIVLIFIIQPHIHRIKVRSADMELTFQEVEVWKQRVNKRIIEHVKYSQPLQKGYYRKNLFIVYKDFNYTDDFVYYIQPTIDAIAVEFQKYGIELEYNYVLSAAAFSVIEKELDLMDTILALNFINTFILTDRFKKAYERKEIKKYTMGLKGEYNLSKNLAISNIQPLYTFKDTPNKGVQNNENKNNKNGK